MEKQVEESFHQLFDKLLAVLTADEEYDREAMKQVVGEICELLHLAKAEVEFYRSLSHEKIGNGDRVCGYDNGKAEKIAYFKRIVTKTSAVVIGSVYVEAGAPPLPEDMLEKIDLGIKVVLSFVSRRRLQFAVERLGYHDEQGYPNMRSFFRFLDAVIRKDGLYGYTAIHFNLRHFGLINREIGRENGDKVMRGYIEELRRTIGESGIVCRLGGDNFLSAFRNEHLGEVLEMMKSCVIAIDEQKEKRVEVSAWVGIFQMPPGFTMVNTAEIMDKLIPVAAAAKAEGGVAFYSDDMIAKKNYENGMLRLIHQALKKREFLVYYQPKVDVKTGEIVGAEALSRWLRDGEIVPPMRFIPVLEQTMDICQLDFYVLDQVCRDIRKWMAEGRKPIRISVNFSRKHMVDPDFMSHVLKIVNKNQVPHEYVEVELTETTTDVEFRDLKRVVSGFQKEGIWTSVDDFGMGYSSLNLIREVPWNVLKIDKSFVPVAGDGLDDTTRRMYKHVVAMAKDIGLECITEGVETIEQVELLRDNGCFVAQGFYFDKPLPIQEFEKRLDERFYQLERTK